MLVARKATHGKKENPQLQVKEGFGMVLSEKIKIVFG